MQQKTELWQSKLYIYNYIIINEIQLSLMPIPLITSNNVQNLLRKQITTLTKQYTFLAG